MKNYYEILEVSEKASKEVIDKAYKVLVKKYHPDLQEKINKDIAERNMQEINEAYEILSNEIQRNIYDEKLEKQRKIEEENKIKEYEEKGRKTERIENEKNKNSVNERNRENNVNKSNNINTQQDYQEEYERYLRGLGYKVKHRWTWKNVKDISITILIMIFIAILLWYFPPTNKWLVNFYNSNSIIKILVDIIKSLFQVIYNAIVVFFKTLI